MAGRRVSRKDVRKVARAICRVATGCCVAGDKRHPCTRDNCRMIAIARRALKEARGR